MSRENFDSRQEAIEDADVFDSSRQETGSVSNRPRNSVTVESPYGLRTFALRDGDVTLSSDSVLVIPTHANEGYDPTGRVLSLAESRFCLDFSNTEKIVSGRRGRVGTYRLCEKGNFRGGEILLVRVPGKLTSDRNSRDNPLELFKESLWTLFGSLAALELRTNSLTSMSMPLLAGTRGYDVSDLLTGILDHSLAWLRMSRYMSTINFYLLNSKALDEWDRAMDKVLGRHSIDTAQNALVGALRLEILALINDHRVKNFPAIWQENLRVLDSSLRSKTIPLERVATDSRRVAELLTTQLLIELTGTAQKGMLGPQLGALKSQKRIAPWITAHLECLLAFGNAGAHSNQTSSFDPPSLNDGDLVGLLASLQRILDFAIQRHAYKQS